MQVWVHSNSDEFHAASHQKQRQPAPPARMCTQPSNHAHTPIFQWADRCSSRSLPESMPSNLAASLSNEFYVLIPQGPEVDASFLLKAVASSSQLLPFPTKKVSHAHAFHLL